MRKTKNLDIGFVENLSDVLPHVYVETTGENSVLVESEIPKQNYEGVPASAFSLSSIIESGGSFNAPPQPESSPVEQRDNFDKSFNALKEKQTQEQIKKQEKKAIESVYNLFRKQD